MEDTKAGAEPGSTVAAKDSTAGKEEDRKGDVRPEGIVERNYTGEFGCNGGLTTSCHYHPRRL